MREVTPEESKAQIARLRARGYLIKTVTLPDGKQVVLSSKKRFVCRAIHQRPKPKKR